LVAREPRELERLGRGVAVGLVELGDVMAFAPLVEDGTLTMKGLRWLCVVVEVKPKSLVAVSIAVVDGKVDWALTNDSVFNFIDGRVSYNSSMWDLVNVLYPTPADACLVLEFYSKRGSVPR